MPGPQSGTTLHLVIILSFLQFVTIPQSFLSFFFFKWPCHFKEYWLVILLKAVSQLGFAMIWLRLCILGKSTSDTMLCPLQWVISQSSQCEYVITGDVDLDHLTGVVFILCTLTWWLIIVCCFWQITRKQITDCGAGRELKDHLL